AGWLPGLSQQKDGLEELISLADGLATAGIAGVRTLQVLPSDAQSDGIGRELIAISESHRGDIGLVASEAAEAIRASSELADDDLIGPLGDARDELLGYRRDLDDLYTMASFALLAPTLLGADGSTSYLVLGMNSGELMPGGGFIGNYAIFDVAQGEVQDIQGEDVYQLYDRWTRSPDFVRVDPPPALERYLLGEEWSWALGEAAWYPDFPTTASAAQEFVRLGGVGTTDATVGLTVPAMEELLRLTGPIELPEFGITFRAEDVGLRLSFDITHDEAGARLFAAFMREMSNRLMALERSSWRSAWEVVRGLVDREELFINFADSDVQKRVAELGWDGRLPPPSGEQRVLLTDASVRSTKLNFALQRRAWLVIDLSGDRPRHRLRVTYRNAYSEWAAGKDPALAQQVLGPTNMLGNYIQLFAPAGSELLRLVEVFSGGATERDLPPEPEEEQLGYSVFATFLPVRPDSERTVEFEYELPAGSSAQVDGHRYRLQLEKQPGVPAYPIDILIVPPDGRAVERIEVCAPTRDACASQTDALVSTELDADLTLVAQFGER
ncbi:MAG TPA: DUF4012 domain-containing protein, partial [Dehalococcoidia bacterium]|nr:DUF4012 domain-containing protein [Dehalococcoidia bacterium]